MKPTRIVGVSDEELKEAFSSLGAEHRLDYERTILWCVCGMSFENGQQLHDHIRLLTVSPDKPRGQVLRET